MDALKSCRVIMRSKACRPLPRDDGREPSMATGSPRPAHMKQAGMMIPACHHINAFR
jgi:hypothetical protein